MTGATSCSTFHCSHHGSFPLPAGNGVHSRSRPGSGAGGPQGAPAIHGQWWHRRRRRLPRYRQWRCSDRLRRRRRAAPAGGPIALSGLLLLTWQDCLICGLCHGMLCHRTSSGLRRTYASSSRKVVASSAPQLPPLYATVASVASISSAGRVGKEYDRCEPQETGCAPWPQWRVVDLYPRLTCIHALP